MKHLPIFIDKQEAKGPINQQIEDAKKFVKKHINLDSRIDGVFRDDFYELPIDSIREMISNAVCHRSYLSLGTIHVAMYDDRLDVTSPGRLSAKLTIEQVIVGNSRIQNNAIRAAFFYMHIIPNIDFCNNPDLIDDRLPWSKNYLLKHLQLFLST